MLLLAASRTRMGASFFAPGLRGGVSIPDHTDYGYDHAYNDLYTKALFSEEQESENQYEDRLHVSEDLKRNGGESAYADELTQICSHCNST